ESIDSGAAQYITKPFAPEVLRAYAWNTLKTNVSAATPSDEICRCGVKLCPTERKVCRGNGDVHLSPIEFDLFFALLEKSPAVVSRDALLAKVWGEDATDTCEHSLEVYVSRLKKKLGEELGGKIKGVYKAGYKFLKSRRPARIARPSGRTKTLRLKR
ncbi:MAG: response regulator transcription factor, partial [Endomicrobiia bacterium]|nr:response regulator transcription factor [Endomicrobiia bacterium]